MPGEALRVPRAQWRQSLTDALLARPRLPLRAQRVHRAQCEGVTPTDITGYDDLHKIPPLPVGMFKQTGAHVLLTAGLADIETEIRLTRTSGVPSVARRDALTTTRASVGILGGYRDSSASPRVRGCSQPIDRRGPRDGMVKVFNLMTAMLDDHRYLARVPSTRRTRWHIYATGRAR